MLNMIDIDLTFLRRYGAFISGITADDLDILLSGPDHEFYDDACVSLCSYGRIRMHGVRYSFARHDNGALYLYAADYDFPEYL